MKNVLDLMKQFGKVSITAAFLLAFTFAFAQDAEIKTAQQLMNKDRKKQALETLQKAAAAYPNAANIYYHLGKAQLLAGDRASAKASFDKGFAVNPKEPLNIVGLGYILLLEKNAAQAKVQFDKALSLGKKNVTTINAIAEAYLTTDKAYEKEAMALLQRSKSLNENNASTYVLLGDAYLIEVNGGSSASAYERATELDPSSAMPWFKLGELFMRSKNMPIVEEKLLKAVSVDPDFALAHRELGEMYYLKKDGVSAAKHYKKYLELTDSPDKDDRTRLAFFYFMAKDFDSANKEFKDICSKPDASSTALKFYAQSLLKSGNLAESEKIIELYLKHPETKVEADDYANLGELRQKQDKDSLAAISYEKSISMDANQPEIHRFLTNYYYSNKKYSDASRASLVSIKSSKRPLAGDYYTLGRSLFYEKKYQQADSAFAKLIELQPKFTLGYWWAARSKSAQDCDFNDPKCKIEWLAKPYYEKVTEVGDPTKDKNQVIEGYRYLVGYYLSKQDFQNGKSQLEKILAVDPDNKDAKEALKDINNPQPQQKKRK